MRQFKLSIRVSWDKEAGSFYVSFSNSIFSRIRACLPGAVSYSHCVEEAAIAIQTNGDLASIMVSRASLPKAAIAFFLAAGSPRLVVDKDSIQIKFGIVKKILKGNIIIDFDSNDCVLGIEIP